MKDCPFCRRLMDLVDDVYISTYECSTCGCRWSYGIESLPDPDRLRGEAEDLEQIADELEAGDGLAGRLQGALS